CRAARHLRPRNQRFHVGHRENDTLLSAIRCTIQRSRPVTAPCASSKSSQPIRCGTKVRFQRVRQRHLRSIRAGRTALVQRRLGLGPDHGPFLKEGRMAVVLDTGAVSRGSGNQGSNKQRDVRKRFVEDDLIGAVLLLPENLFYNTTAPGIVMVLSKRKRKPGEILLINGSKLFSKGRPKNYLE